MAEKKDFGGYIILSKREYYSLIKVIRLLHQQSIQKEVEKYVKEKTAHV